MTREEAYEILKTGICIICAYGCKNMDDCDISYCDIRDAVKTVMEEPCEDAWIIDSLKEFLGESYSVLTSDKKEFTSWLERLRWHVAKCNEIDTELRNYKKQVECENAISREDALMCMTGEFLPFVLYKPEDIISKRIQRIKDLPPVQPKIRTGKWIYRNYNWYCSECENTPKTLGYVGTAEFMKEHFKFCNHCGAMMLDTVMTEDEEEADDESGN